MNAGIMAQGDITFSGEGINTNNSIICSKTGNITVDSVTLKFEISDEYEENVLGLFPENEELNGIKRLNVFKYFEDINMLLPIETKFDFDKNIVYTEADELGTYCLMDMEQWFVSLGILGEEYQPQPMLFSLASSVYEEIALERFSEEDSKIGFRDDAVGEEAVPLLGSERRLSYAPSYQKNVTPVDVVMLLQTSGQLRDVFRTQKDMIVKVMDDLIGNNDIGDVRFCIITYDIDSGAKILEETPGDIWFENSSVLASKLEKVTYKILYDPTDYTDRGNAFRKVSEDVKFKENASKFIFQIMNGSSYVGDMYFEQISTCKRLEINYSELMPEQIYYIDEDYKREVDDAIAATKGMNITYTYHAASDVYEHICKNVAPPQNKFKAIVPLDYREITLNSILERNGMTDTDGDSITDWNEIENTLIKWNTDGTVVLPTFGECQNLPKKTYADSGLFRFGVKAISEGKKAEDISILPIRSDPTKEDSDGDGLLDGKSQKFTFKDGIERVIAPVDPEPMERTGSENLWNNHLKEIKNADNVPNKYDLSSSGFDYTTDEKTAKEIVEFILMTRKTINDTSLFWKVATSAVKMVSEGDTELGAYILNFIHDENEVVYHSQIKTWQREFGYNKFYDEVFKIGSKMQCGRIEFTVDNNKYALWAWKGDYWNMQSGAEVGLYKFKDVMSKTEHYDAVDFEVPMTLSLYNYIGEGEYENVFHWVPTDSQWWITGFNPEYKKPNPKEMATIACVDLSEHRELFDAINDKENADFSKDDLKEEHVFCDEENKMVWIQWYNERTMK